MEKVEFTAEQVKYLKEEWIASPERNFIEFANSLLKPETKFIDVRIEYDNDIMFDVSYLQNIIEKYRDVDFRNRFKVTELPEVFSRQDMIEFANYHHHVDETVETNINDWLSERKSK